MSKPVEITTHIHRMIQHLKSARKLKSEAEYHLVMAGLELNAARERVNAGETNLSWESWIKKHVSTSWRDIDRLLELKARIRSGRPIGLRAHKLHQAYEMGGSDYLRHIHKNDCPYHRLRLTWCAWLSGWTDMELREQTNEKCPTPAPLCLPGNDSRSALRLSIVEYWPLLLRGGQDQIMKWIRERRSSRQSH
jgi:hypothetical protein